MSAGISSSLVSSAGFVELCFLRRFEEDEDCWCCCCWAVNSDADATFLISASISAVGLGFSSELLGELRVALPDYCYFLAVLLFWETVAADCDLAMGGSWVVGSCCAFDVTDCFLVS